MKSISRWTFKVFAAALFCGIVQGNALAAGDAEAGKVKASTCIGCHGITNYSNVYPSYRVPKLGGQHPDYIVQALKAYQSGERAHTTMHAQTSEMSDQDMADLAAYLTSAPAAQ